MKLRPEAANLECGKLSPALGPATTCRAQSGGKPPHSKIPATKMPRLTALMAKVGRAVPCPPKEAGVALVPQRPPPGGQRTARPTPPHGGSISKPVGIPRLFRRGPGTS